MQNVAYNEFWYYSLFQNTCDAPEYKFMKT